jgi:hypothetical protein
VAEATYAQLSPPVSPPATQVARPPAWSRNSGLQRRPIAPRHGDTATQSGPKLRPSQVPVRPANLEFAYGVSLDGNVAGPGDASEREADRLASSVADAGSPGRGGAELGRSDSQIAAAAGGTEPSVHLAAANHVVQRWPGDMHVTARRDSGRPMNAHPDAVATSLEGRHDPRQLAYELATAGFRPKLKVDQPGDVYEQEADEIADRVMRSPAGDASGSQGGQCCSGCASGVGCSGGLQRQAAAAGSLAPSSEVSSATESRIRSGDSTGQPLPGPTRAFFEPRFGCDLSDVRVHSGPDAAQLSGDLQAHAFTHGSHIWLGSGLSPEPSHVLAHELAHVVQQVGPTAAASTGHDPELTHVVQHQRSGPGSGTLQRVVCFGEWRHADTDPTALEAYDKIERAYKALEAAVHDPAVSEQSKMEMAEAIRRSLESLRSYMKEIEGTCSSRSGGSPLMLGTTTTGIDPLQAAIALFAVLLAADTARRMSMPEQHAMGNLSNAMTQLANAVRKLAEPARMPTKESTPARVEPRETLDPIPPPLPKPEPREDDRRRRRRCTTDWVPRIEDTESQRYHNDFARQMVTDLHILASPELEFRVYRGSASVPLDYDSHDGLSQDFFEFKTRYQYLPYEQLGVTWFATSGMVAQARDQKATMLDCGYYSELVWVFDNEDVAYAARPFLESADAADRVIAQHWVPARPAPGRRR